MPEWVAKWLKIGLSTETADFDAAEQAMRNMYASAKLKQPRVVLRMSSPYGAILGGVMAEALLSAEASGAQVWDQVGAQVRAQVGDQVGDQVWAQVRAQVRAQVGDQVGDQVGAQVGAQVRAQVGDQVGAQVRAQVGAQVGDQVGDQVWDQVWDQVGAQVRAQVGAQVGDQVRAQVGDQVRAQVGAQVRSRWSNSLYQNLDAGFHAWVTFFRDVCGWENHTLPAYANHEILSQHASWSWWAPDVGAISDKPEILNRDERGRLHSTTGPAIRFRDGWSIYAVHGVRMPSDIFENRSSLTVARIEAEQNTEIRRVMIDLYGPAKYLKDSGAQIVHSLPADHAIVGLRSAVLMTKQVPGDETIVMIDLLNSTPEPDGTTKRYQLRVDPSAYDGTASRDCHAAAASTWRMPDGSLAFKRYQDYRPAFES
jgi:hypothetical protein